MKFGATIGRHAARTRRRARWVNEEEDDARRRRGARDDEEHGRPVRERARRVVLGDGARIGALRRRARLRGVALVGDRDASEDRRDDRRRDATTEHTERRETKWIRRRRHVDGCADSLRVRIVIEHRHADGLRAGVDDERPVPRLLSRRGHVERVRARIDRRVFPRGRADHGSVFFDLEAVELRDARGHVDRRVRELRLERRRAPRRRALAIAPIVAPRERHRSLIRTPRARRLAEPFVTNAEGELDAARRIEARALFEFRTSVGESFCVEEFFPFAKKSFGDRRSVLRTRSRCARDARKDERRERATECRGAS